MRNNYESLAVACNQVRGKGYGIVPPEEKEIQIAAADDSQEEMVWISATGSKYHSIPDCGNMNPDNATEMTRSQAEAAGYKACKKCY